MKIYNIGIRGGVLILSATILAFIPINGAKGASFESLGSFNTNDGAGAAGTLALVGSTLYGTTFGGGANNDGTVFAVSLDAVPEPSTCALLGVGALLLLTTLRRKIALPKMG